MFYPDKVYDISNKRPTGLHEHLSIRFYNDSPLTYGYDFFCMNFLSHHNYTPTLSDPC